MLNFAEFQLGFFSRTTRNDAKYIYVHLLLFALAKM